MGVRNTPLHLCRLRYFDHDRWSLAFYTYSHEKYEPCVYPNGGWFGTPEEAFDIGATYLTDLHRLAVLNSPAIRQAHPLTAKTTRAAAESTDENAWSG